MAIIMPAPNSHLCTLDCRTVSQFIMTFEPRLRLNYRALQSGQQLEDLSQFRFCLLRCWLIMMSIQDWSNNPVPRSGKNMGQTQLAIEESIARPLTTLSEDEQMFRDSVREFAEGEIRKRVEQMDEQGHFDPALMKHCFELG